MISNHRFPAPRLCASLFLLACALCLWVAPSAAGETPRVVILGFDGVDAELTQRWMDEGQLPNLARLREEGTFAPLSPTIPSQTPVSWSTFSTGVKPGKHGIFDFLRRDPATYKPAFAAFEESSAPFLWGARTPWIVGGALGLLLALLLFGVLRLARARRPLAVGVALVLGAAAGVGAGRAADRLLPENRPVVVNRQQGDTFWKILGDAGKKVKVIRMPVTFPPKPYEGGHLLSGLGTPDLSLRIGKPFYFTSELFFSPATGGEFSTEIVELYDNQGVIETEIKGPPNKLFPEGDPYIVIPMTLTVAEDRSSLKVEVSDNDLTLEPGQWSEWVPFTFPFNPAIQLHGIGRFHLLSVEPEVRLYLSPIMFDPRRLPPILDITTPRSFAGDLVDRFGLFKTIGWAIDTWSMADRTIDEEVFMEDVRFTVDTYREMLLGLLGDEDWDVLVHYFEFTDRVQHIMYRYFDPEHPMYEAEKAARWSGSILESYQMMDAIVGEVMERMPEGAALFVVSDHGFASFRRGMNYNTWLVENGYMTLEGQDDGLKTLQDLFDQGDFFVNVDWSRTKAYALGLGEIYINLKGRERDGIVEPGAEYDALIAELKANLEAYVDEETGEHPVAYVFTREEAYGTYDPELMPDLVPSNSEGYRVGWQDSLGGFGRSVIEPNDRVWSGDHCSVYPPLVQGILFSNLRLAKEDPYMADVMPTLLEMYGVEPSPELDGESLLPAAGR